MFSFIIWLAARLCFSKPHCELQSGRYSYRSGAEEYGPTRDDGAASPTPSSAGSARLWNREIEACGRKPRRSVGLPPLAARRTVPQPGTSRSKKAMAMRALLVSLLPGLAAAQTCTKRIRVGTFGDSNPEALAIMTDWLNDCWTSPTTTRATLCA